MKPWIFKTEKWRGPKLRNDAGADWRTLSVRITCQNAADAEFIRHELDMFLASINVLMHKPGYEQVLRP